ncbi:aquaporin [Manduca sexta]|uniref:Uncharacterized protein n=1 Tax=Manduca sexta TaxID=7130 RepID=A0A921Z4V1_MANSE|nr:aquaporin [Manduca sexta]KAG6450911.1 hypothetical protein O3G_MSEX006826 [Manduca sexta]
MTVTLNPQTLVDVVENKITPDPSKASGLNAICAWCSEQWRAILAEFVSTMLLIVFGCMACIPLDGFTPQPPLYGPLGFGLTVSFNIQIFGHISGAHMNPAVTLAAVIWGSMSITLALAYALAQCIGAIVGYGILVAVAPINVLPIGVCLTMPHAGHTLIQALGVEMVLTAALSFINCACWDPVNAQKQESVAIKFGLAIAGLSIAGGPLTGASMNPARSLGPALWTSGWYAHWVYWVGPCVGSALAAFIYKFIWLKKQD